MSKIIGSSDGSYAEGKGGFAFLLDFEDGQSKELLAYGNTTANNPTIVELLAIKRLLQYVILEDLYKYDIEIRCDVSEIMYLVNYVAYKGNNKYIGGKGNSKFVKSNFDFIDSLISLIEFFPQNKLKFVPVKSNKCQQNRVVHNYANIARKMNLLDEECIYVLNKRNSSGLYEIKEKINDIERNTNSKRTLLSNIKDHVRWYDLNDKNIVYINTCDISINENIHLKCSNIQLNDILFRVKQKGCIDTPLAVRLIEDGKYTLVMGLTRFIAVKALDIPIAPCIITDMCYQDFKKSCEVD